MALASQGVLDSVTGALDSGNLFSSFNTGLLGNIWFWAKVVIIGGVILIGLMFLFKFLFQFKVRISVWRKIGDGWEVKKDMAKIIVDKQNKRKLQLFKTRNGKRPVTCPIPAFGYLGKEGKRDHYNLYLDDNYNLHPIDLPTLYNEGDTDYEKSIIQARTAIRPQERDAWSRYEARAIEDKFKKKDMIEKYLPAGIIMIACVTAFLLFFFGFKELGTQMAAMSGQMGQVATSCLSIAP